MLFVLRQFSLLLLLTLAGFAQKTYYLSALRLLGSLPPMCISDIGNKLFIMKDVVVPKHPSR